jgi:hypothetical protein
MKHWNKRYPNRFNLDANEDYKKWRDEKLESYPENISDLVVDLADMQAITPTEKSKIMDIVEQSNMCVYTSGSAQLNMNSLLKLGEQLNVFDHDKSIRHAKSDELTDSGILDKAVPFSTRSIRWHTDATYYGSNKTIQSLFLLCKQPAIEGGCNKVLDHEILYIILRDKNPDALRVLMNNDCFEYKNPKTGEINSQLGGKVFWVNENGRLCHRFSFRKMDMSWSGHNEVIAAKDILESTLIEESKYVIEGRLESGMGLISNNVLHTRESLVDSEDISKKRLLFRARFYDGVGVC